MGYTCTVNENAPSFHAYTAELARQVTTWQSAVYHNLLSEWYSSDYDGTSEAEAWKFDLRKMESDGTSDAALWGKKSLSKWHIGNYPVV